MTASNILTNLFDDTEQLSKFEDVITNAHPFPTLAPYGDFVRGVLVYNTVDDEEATIARFQEFTDQMARVQNEEIWTWMVQWRADGSSTTQRQNEASTSRKRLRVHSSAPRALQVMAMKTKVAKYPPKSKERSAYFGRPLLHDEDIMRALLDIVHATSNSLPNFISILYQWIDMACGDGFALQCALREEIPCLFGFDHHTFSMQPNQPRIKGPNDSSTGGVLVEPSNRLQYQEKRFGLRPLADGSQSPYANIPHTTSKADDYFAACYRQREKALILLAKAGLTPGQICHYRRNQTEHPMDTMERARHALRLRNMEMELPSYIRSNLMTKWWSQISAKWNEASRNHESAGDDQDDTKPELRPLPTNLLTLPYRNACFAAAQAYKAGFSSNKRNWFANEVPLVPLAVRDHLRSDMFSNAWATQSKTGANNPMPMIIDEAELSCATRNVIDDMDESTPGIEMVIKEEPGDDSDEFDLALVLSKPVLTDGADANSDISEPSVSDDEATEDGEAESERYVDEYDDDDEFDDDEYDDDEFDDDEGHDQGNQIVGQHGTAQHPQAPVLPPWPFSNDFTRPNFPNWVSLFQDDQLRHLLNGVGIEFDRDPHPFINYRPSDFEVDGANRAVAPVQAGIQAGTQAGRPDLAIAHNHPPVGTAQVQNFPAQPAYDAHQMPAERTHQPGHRPPALYLEPQPMPVPNIVVTSASTSEDESQLEVQVSVPDHTGLTPSFNRLTFDTDVLDNPPTDADPDVPPEDEGRNFLENPQIMTLRGLVEKASPSVPIMMYFPCVINSGSPGYPVDADAIMLGTFQPETGEYEFSTAMFFNRRVREALFRGVEKLQWSLSVAFQAQSNLDGFHSNPRFTFQADPHRRAFARLNQAFSLITGAGGMRDHVLTKRWRVSQSDCRKGNRGAIWEGFALGVDRGISMTHKHRRGDRKPMDNNLLGGFQALTIFGDESNDEFDDERAREIEEEIEENLSDGGTDYGDDFEAYMSDAATDYGE